MPIWHRRNSSWHPSLMVTELDALLWVSQVSLHTCDIHNINHPCPDLHFIPSTPIPHNQYPSILPYLSLTIHFSIIIPFSYPCSPPFLSHRLLYPDIFPFSSLSVPHLHLFFLLFTVHASVPIPYHPCLIGVRNLLWIVCWRLDDLNGEVQETWPLEIFIIRAVSWCLCTPLRLLHLVSSTEAPCHCFIHSGGDAICFVSIEAV